MKPLKPGDLLSLEEYAKQRVAFRRNVLEHKRNRQLALSENFTLYFEDRLTIQYQVQEMLRIERIFEQQGIADELEAYNPLIPDGDNLKATFMIEYPDVDERRRELARLQGVEDRVWLRVDGFQPVFAIADEDLDRSDETKTSAVHFVRFQFDSPRILALKGGAALSAGVDHEACQVQVNPVPAAIRAALLRDFD